MSSNSFVVQWLSSFVVRPFIRRWMDWRSEAWNIDAV